ncbi:MAG: TetR/AcrR family transcriptional regulator [Actinoallomurus sp.]
MRDRILAAAVTVMRERGVTNTTTKEIARVAGVAEGSIYNHFANKTELVAASMAEVAGGIRDALIRLSGRAGASTVEANLAELAEAEITFFADLLPITGPVLGDHDLREWLYRGGPQADTGTDSPESRRQDTAQAPATPGAAGTGAVAPGAAGGDAAGAKVSGGPPSPEASNLPGGAARPSQAGQGGVPALGPVLGHVALIGYLEAERQAGRLVADARPAYLAAALIGACQQYAFVRLLTPPATMSELAGLPPDPAEYAREVVHAILAGHLSNPTYPA